MTPVELIRLHPGLISGPHSKSLSVTTTTLEIQVLLYCFVYVRFEEGSEKITPPGLMTIMYIYLYVGFYV